MPPRLHGEDVYPLYYRLREYIRQQILSGAYSDGRLPSELEFQERFKVSRITVRRALDDLRREGLVERWPGRGTFARPLQQTRPLSRLTSFYEDMRALGRTPHSQVLSIEVSSPPPRVQAMLNLAASSPAVRIERLRLADAVPMALQVSWVPASLCPGLEHEDLEHHSLFGLIESKFGLAIGYARETIEAREASARESQLLGLRRAGVPVLYVERIVYLQDDTPIEFVQSVCRSDTYKFSIQLVR